MEANLEQTEPNVSPIAEGLSPSAGPRVRILYVEDDTDICEMVSLMLSHKGYEVVTTGTCNEALKLAKASRFDLYIIDNTLPDGSGLDLCKLLRSLDSNAAVLFCSGWPRDEYMALAVEFGARGYLTKPFAPEELLCEVTKLLQQFSDLKDNDA